MNIELMNLKENRKLIGEDIEGVKRRVKLCNYIIISKYEIIKYIVVLSLVFINSCIIHSQITILYYTGLWFTEMNNTARKY